MANRRSLVVLLLLALALLPCRRDRAKFAALYREVPFADGRLDAADNSFVRQFRFKDAADRIFLLRPKLETWCHDALAIRACEWLDVEAYE